MVEILKFKPKKKKSNGLMAVALYGLFIYSVTFAVLLGLYLALR